MMPLLVLAEATAESANIGMLVIGLTSILNLGLLATQWVKGNKGERQIEPTQLAAIGTELQRLTTAVNSLNREVGTLSAATEQVEGLHIRVGGISRELAATVARVDGLEKRESFPRRHA
jgi:hypothetical protein